MWEQMQSLGVGFWGLWWFFCWNKQLKSLLKLVNEFALASKLPVLPYKLQGYLTNFLWSGQDYFVLLFSVFSLSRSLFSSPFALALRYRLALPHRCLFSGFLSRSCCSLAKQLMVFKDQLMLLLSGRLLSQS